MQSVKRSSPTWPDPHGGPPKRGCLYMGRFALLALACLWAGVLLAHPGPHIVGKILAAAGFSVPFGILICIPLFNLADRLELRRYCKARGFKILKFQWRGVVYMDGDVKRYSRWPDDFQKDPQAPKA